MAGPDLKISLTVNGIAREDQVPVRLLLSDYVRHTLGLTGTHVGCEHGVCGACTILVDGAPVRACLMFAVQADGCALETVESLTPPGEPLAPLPAAFRDEHGLQCGFCTAGIMMSLVGLARAGEPDEQAIVNTVAGHLCRCTGYRNIIRAANRGLGLTVEPSDEHPPGTDAAEHLNG
jgi:carbon-monoxide dehydrogenase small subunit